MMSNKSTKTEIKICGLSTPQTLEAVLEAGADYVGFIFFEKSPRNISPETAAGLANQAREKGKGQAKIVAVTVNADNEFLAQIVSQLRPDYLQLHGSESPQRVAEIKKRFGLPVIKAFAIREAADLENLELYRSIADRFLLDTKAPEGSDLPGGNGISFDWKLLEALPPETDYMLSGGLNRDNIAEALRISDARAIDVSSGVEAAPGIKDVAKITAFIQTVRDCDDAALSTV